MVLNASDSTQGNTHIMPDVMSKDQRSRLMAAVRGRNTRFELTMMRALSADLYPLGYRYRKHYRGLRGTPDIVFVGYRLAVFLDSDFWHGRNYHRLKSRMNAFWRTKIERNMERDRQVDRALRRLGWSVLRFGESEIKGRPQSVVRKVRRKLKSRRCCDQEVEKRGKTGAGCLAQKP
jgi:DNA mismatch endonuclease (patch repair protein)